MKSEVQGTVNLTCMSVQAEQRQCLCCGEPFFCGAVVDQDFCDRCYPVVRKAVFDKDNGSLTCEQLREKIRKEK